MAYMRWFEYDDKQEARSKHSRLHSRKTSFVPDPGNMGTSITKTTAKSRFFLLMVVVESGSFPPASWKSSAGDLL